jgi:hypothetical protein
MVERIFRILSPIFLGFGLYAGVVSAEPNQEVIKMAQPATAQQALMEDLQQADDVNTINSGNFHVSRLGQVEVQQLGDVRLSDSRRR